MIPHGETLRRTRRSAARRAPRVAAAARGALLATGLLLLWSCDQVFGLAPPRLDPCADNGCPDVAGTILVTNTDGSAPTADASIPPLPVLEAGASADATPPQPVSIPCGAGAQACTGASQICCALPNNRGYDFVCMSQGSACSGTPVGCARQSDCAAPFVCCDLRTTVACVTAATCNGPHVCDPLLVPSDCPAGLACQLTSDPGWPYHACL